MKSTILKKKTSSTKINQDVQRLFTRRALIVAGMQAGVFSVLLGRMRQLQIRDASDFRPLAEENRIKMNLIPPQRGRIYDRNGFLLADNEQNYRAVLQRDEVDDVRAVLDKIAQLIPLSVKEREVLYREILRHNPFVPVTIADQLTWDEFSQIAVNGPALPGVSPDVGYSRFYTLGEDYAHILGYVGPVSDYDTKRHEGLTPLLKLPRFQIGKIGIETKLETELRGKFGTRRIEVNAHGREMRELERFEPNMGEEIQITIDSALQNYVQERLKGLNAACIVMDIENGDLLAIGSDPSFDPNKFVRGISVDDYNALLENPYRPLFNKAVQGIYPPGSVYKMVTLLAALRAGVISENEKIICKGFVERKEHKFHCWKSIKGHGPVDLLKSISESCDVYYYELAERTGIEKMSAMAQELGLGHSYDLPLSAVARGLAPTKAWKRRVKKRDWVIGDSLNAAIGQGYVLASPLQLAVMTARLASGKAIEPRLISKRNFVPNTKNEPAPLDIDPQMLAAVRRSMFNAVNHKKGTAYLSRSVAKNMLIAGKTGTSQVRNISKAERKSGTIKNEDLPFERRDHALFAGFVPFDSPRFVVSVVVEHGGSGSRVAAPIARDILLRTGYGRLPPLFAYPKDQRVAVQEEQSQLKLRTFSEPDFRRAEKA